MGVTEGNTDNIQCLKRGDIVNVSKNDGIEKDQMGP